MLRLDVILRRAQQLNGISNIANPLLRWEGFWWVFTAKCISHDSGLSIPARAMCLTRIGVWVINIYDQLTTYSASLTDVMGCLNVFHGIGVLNDGAQLLVSD